MSDVISHFHERRDTLRNEKAARPKPSRSKELEMVYDERISIRSLFANKKKVLSILLIIVVVAVASSLLLRSVQENYRQIQLRSNPLDKAFAEFLDSMKRQFGWTNDGIHMVLGAIPTIAVVIIVLIFGITTFPRFYAWRRSRIFINEDVFRVENKEILKTGSDTELSSQVLRGVKVNRTFFDVIFRCATVDVFMMDMSGVSDNMHLRFVRKPRKLQRVVHNLTTRSGQRKGS